MIHFKKKLIKYPEEYSEEILNEKIKTLMIEINNMKLDVRGKIDDLLKRCNTVSSMT